MIYTEIGGERVSLVFIGFGVGMCAASVIGAATAVLFPGWPFAKYLWTTAFVFLISFSGTIAVPGLHAWRAICAELSLRTARAWQEEQKIYKPAAAAVIDVAPEIVEEPKPSIVEREVPVNDKSGQHTVIIESEAPAFEHEWREAAVNFLYHAWRIGSLTSPAMVKHSIVTKTNEWVRMTDVLAKSGYIVKINGKTTALNPRYSYASAIAAIQRGRSLPHPAETPPFVLERPVKDKG